MVGITGYGFYVPRFRLERAQIGRAWGSKAGAGECAVAYYDEDSLTLAAEAASSCLIAGADRNPDGLLFASTSSPYSEKQVAGYLTTVCDLPRGTWTADFAGSVRAGISAVVAGWHAVLGGTRSDVVVTAADMRLAEPEGELEGWFGDAAAAVRIGSERLLAEIIGHASISEEFTHFWRTDQSRFVQVQSGRFSDVYGYARDLGEAVRALMAKHGLEPGDVGRVALATPGPRAAADLAKELGFDAKRQLVTAPFDQIGSAGVADPLLALISCLEAPRENEFVIVGGYGEGADAILLRLTGDRRPGEASLSAHLAAKSQLPTYEKYLKFRRIVPTDEAAEVVTNVLEFNELRQDVRLYGSRCEPCGTVQYPMARVCIRCGARETLVDHKLARRGEVFTYTVDHLIANLEHPLPMVVVDLSGGGRLYLQGTDGAPEELGVAAPVQLTFRRLHEGGGNHNYYWKARPPR